MTLTDQEIETLVPEVARDLWGTDAPALEKAMDLMDNHSLTDGVRYPNDPKKQLVLESIVMGATMESAFDNLPDDEAFTRGKILAKFLSLFGINL